MRPSSFGPGPLHARATYIGTASQSRTHERETPRGRLRMKPRWLLGCVVRNTEPACVRRVRAMRRSSRRGISNGGQLRHLAPMPCACRPEWETGRGVMSARGTTIVMRCWRGCAVDRACSRARTEQSRRLRGPDKAIKYFWYPVLPIMCQMRYYETSYPIPSLWCYVK